MVEVNPDAYYKAAKTCSTLAQDVANSAKPALSDGFLRMWGMGGNYPAVAWWNNAYNQNHNDLLTFISAFVDAVQHFGDILNAAGYNWEKAEFNSCRDPGKGPGPTKPSLSTAPLLTSKDLPALQKPSGYNEPDIDGGVEANIDKVQASLRSAMANLNTPFPNGSTETLGDAAAVWNTFATCQAVTSAGSQLKAAADSFNSVKAPEVPDIVQALGSLQQAAVTIEDASAGLSKAINAHRDALSALRSQLAAEVPDALPEPGYSASASSDPAWVSILCTDGVKPETITTAANTFASLINGSALYSLLHNVHFDNVDGLTATSDITALASLPMPNESGNPNDNTATSKALESITVKDVQDGVNSKGEQTKTISMADGSKTVLTQTTMTDPDGGANAQSQPTVKYETYDKNGKLASTTESYKNADGALCTLTSVTDSKSGKPITILQVAGANGHNGYTQVTAPDGHTATGPYEWFSHPVLDGVGGTASGLETMSDVALEKLPTTTLVTEGVKSLEDLHGGARFLGPAATIVGSALDVASGNSSLSDGLGSAAYQLDGGTLGSVGAVAAGRFIGTLFGAADPIPGVDFATAAIGGTIGGEVGGWVYNEVK